MVQKKNKDTQVLSASKAGPATYVLRRLYDKSAPMLIAEAILFAIVGCVMLFKPVGVLAGLTFVFGCALVLFGLYRIIAGFVSSRGYGGGWMDVLFGLLNVVLGVVFCMYPVGSIIGLVYIFVVLFLVQAVRAFVFAIQMVRVRFGHYIFNLIMSIILVALAVLLLFYPLAGGVVVMVWIALTMLLYAGADLYMFFELRRLKKVVSE